MDPLNPPASIVLALWAPVPSSHGLSLLQGADGVHDVVGSTVPKALGASTGATTGPGRVGLEHWLTDARPLTRVTAVLPSPAGSTGTWGILPDVEEGVVIEGALGRVLLVPEESGTSMTWHADPVTAPLPPLDAAHARRQVHAATEEAIDALRSDVRAIDRRIATANADLRRLEKRLGERKQQYAHLVCTLYERCTAHNKWIFLLSSDNFARFIRRLRYLHEYASWQKQQALSIVDRQKEIDEKRAALAAVRGEKADLLEVRATELSRLKDAETEQRTGVRRLEARQTDLTRDLARQQQQAEALDRRIEQLATEEMAAAARAKNAEQTARKNRRKPDAPSRQDRKLSDDFAHLYGTLTSEIDSPSLRDD